MFFNQSDAKLKPMRLGYSRFSALHAAFLFLPRVPIDCLVLVSTTLNRKALYLRTRFERYDLLLLFMFVGGNEIFNVEKSIGSGAFAKVFLAKKFGDNDDNDFETDDESSVVLKVGCLFQVDQNISSEKIFW